MSSTFHASYPARFASIRVERVNSHIDIVVSDTGIGIRADFLRHVFERFRQADAGLTRQTSGLGLGLSIVRHIVELHGGDIAASNAEGRSGAVFTVRLPLVESDECASAETGRAEAVPGGDGRR